MGAQSNLAPIIIKRKKIIAGGHHGGAWKVAYADFVTAMMAFFLLMWLLNATTEKQRKGVADYFSPTIAINRISGGGDGSFGGDSVFSQEDLPQNGTGATNQRPTESQQSRGETGVTEADEAGQAQAVLDKIEDILTGRGGESAIAKEMQRHIITRVTDEGLVIELFDLEGARLFVKGTDTPTPLLDDLADLLSVVLDLVTNSIAVEGYIRSEPVVLVDNPVWDLSSSRANRMRLLLQAGGLDPKRMQRVTGHADREPVASNLMSVRNNRLEVILLRSDK